jgi:hypothetical protein
MIGYGRSQLEAPHSQDLWPNLPLVLMVMSWLVTRDRAGPLGGKGRQLVGKVGEWYVESWHLQGYSPHQCRLRIDELAPTSKY